MVAFHRPKGYRGSYLQWRENGIAPQVVFEILSPGNRTGEMQTKRAWYERFGVQEYYEYDPDRKKLGGWLRPGTSDDFAPLDDGFVSPLLGIRFDLPNGEPMRVFRLMATRFYRLWKPFSKKKPPSATATMNEWNAALPRPSVGRPKPTATKKNSGRKN